MVEAIDAGEENIEISSDIDLCHDDRYGQSYFGFVERFNEGVVTGWCFRADAPSSPVELVVRLGTHVVGEVVASLPRSDLEDRLGHPVAAGFHFSWSDCDDDALGSAAAEILAGEAAPEEAPIRIHVKETGQPLGASSEFRIGWDVVLPVADALPLPEAEAPQMLVEAEPEQNSHLEPDLESNLEQEDEISALPEWAYCPADVRDRTSQPYLRGFVDSFDKNGVRGWCIDVRRPSQPVQLIVSFLGIDLASVVTDKQRSDLEVILASPCRGGFELDWSAASVPPEAILRLWSRVSAAPDEPAAITVRTAEGDLALLSLQGASGGPSVTNAQLYRSFSVPVVSEARWSVREREIEGWIVPRVSGTIELEMRINGEVVRDEKLSVESGEKRTFSFEVPDDVVENKSYAVEIFVPTGGGQFLTNQDGGFVSTLRVGPKSVSVDFDESNPPPIAADSMKIFFYPDYTATNPYQSLLASSLPEGAEAVAGTIEDAIQFQQSEAATHRHQVVFHLHWTGPIFAGAPNQWEATRQKDAFLARLRAFVGAGGLLIWTIHNILSHDRRYSEVERDLNTELGRLASCVHLHSIISKEAILQEYPIPDSKFVVIPHPNYIGVYANYVDRRTARRRLKIPEDRLVYAFIGQVRPYKGITDLIAAQRSLQATNPSAHLLIAGSPVYPYKAGTMARYSTGLPNVTIVEGHLPDDDLQWMFNAADFVVLPYKSILTSGSVLNALSFDRPVIAPRLGMIPEVVEHGRNGFTYDPEERDALSRVLVEAAALSPEERAEMEAAAGASVAHLTWDAFGRALVDAVTTAATKYRVTLDVAGQSVTVTSSRKPGPREKQAKIAAVILNYKHITDVQRLLSSLDRSDVKDFEVFVVDNHSPQLRFSEFRSTLTSNLLCTFIQTDDNIGYAAGNNAGIAFAKQQNFEFIWVLNPDIEATPDALKALLSAAESHEDVNVFGSVIYYGHDKSKIWFGGANISFNHGLTTSHCFNGLNRTALPDAPYPSDYITGASLFCRREAFAADNYIPEEYFLYFEETEWCMRIREAGQRLLVVPDSVLYHHKRSEAGQLPAPYYFYYYVRNAMHFIQKFSPSMLHATGVKLRQNFVNKWLAKIKKGAPTKLVVYEKLAESAFADFDAGLTGRRDLFELMFSAEYAATKLLPGPFTGALDNISNDAISGWAWCPSHPEGKCKVSLFIDGEYVETKTANVTRKELTAAGVGDGNYGFYFNSLTTLLDGRCHSVEIRVEGRFFKQQEVQLPYKPKYRGRIEGIVGYTIQGWALNDSNPSEKLDVQIAIEGDVLAVGRCDVFRADLLSAGVGDGSHGFSIRLPSRVINGQSQNLSLFLAGSSQKLFNLAIQPKRVGNLPPVGGNIGSVMAWLFLHREAAFDKVRLATLFAHAEQTRQLYVELCRDRPETEKVSVVMPAFNRADTIVESMHSVLAQTYQNLELLVVDDGSTDRTVDIVREFIETDGSGRVRLLPLGVNRGVSAARNVALAEATGSVIAYLDSDNVWEPDFLTVMVHQLLDHPETDSAYCGQSIWHVFQSVTGEEISEQISVRTGGFWLSLMENRNYIDLNCFVHKSSCVRMLGGFNEEMRRLVDWELIWRYSSLKAPRFVPVLLSRYFMDKAGNQITSLEKYEPNLLQLQEAFRQHNERLFGLVRPEGLESPEFDVVIPYLNGETETQALDSVLSSASGSVRRVVVLAAEDGDLKETLREQYGMDERVEILPVDTTVAVSPGTLLERTLEQIGDSNGLVLLSPDALVHRHCFGHLAHASSLVPDAAVIISRYMVPISASNARQAMPFAVGQFPVDIALAQAEIGSNDLSVGWTHHLFDVRTIPFFCSLLTKDTLKWLRPGLLTSTSFGELTGEIANQLELVDRRRIVYAGRAITSKG